ncbi:Plant calmodulin-binding protein-related [Quillaja saponaria]|uniref:Plant calmodulin-binding protein-related n=1 Tax=Quillaja saponaria TaxID=32244 RepID=A0AAD7Q3R1_QUISA|nr:Plant calmodulin-binding protein-related [Quillaja saponaria]KAJ7974343.1 Plant calmodulin-binding protein-related [Quillaja saponaria]
MAEETVGLPVTSEVTKPGGVNLRRNSTGKGNPENSEEKILPHYLRASTGSCHDFCKYGKKHAFELKEKHPIPKRGTRKPLDGHNSEVIILLPGTKRTSVLKLNASLDSIMPNTSDTKKCEMSTKAPGSQKQIESEVMETRKKALLVKAKPSPQLKSGTSGIPKTMKPEISPASEKGDISSKLASSRAKEMKLSAKRATSSKPKVAPVKPISSLDSSKGTKGQSNIDVKKGKGTTASEEAVKKSQTPSRALLSSKPSLSRVLSINARKHRSLKSLSQLKNQHNTRTVEPKLQNNKEINERKQRSLKVSQLKNQHKTRTIEPKLQNKKEINEKKQRSLKVVSHMKNQAKTKKDESREHNNEEVPEKTLYVIKVESEKKSLESDQNASDIVDLSVPPSSLSPEFLSSSRSQSYSSEEEDQEESEYSVSDADDNSFSGDNEIENAEDAETLEGENKRNSRKNVKPYSEDKDCQSLKLKFRRGRVVDAQSESNGLRRLKFRRGKRLENLNVKADVQRKGFKRTDGADGEVADTAAGPEKVVLRHQDTQGKKDDQGLFNNVIEETASKLAETRKSKVKALVGAFETVISLQERKTSANTGS